MKKHAPATERNRDPIAKILKQELPPRGTVLEIASGTGEHAVHFAGQLPTIRWQPSDPDPDAAASIAAYRDDYGGENLLEPVIIDASEGNWPVTAADAVVCINMIHISPWAATIGLFTGSSGLLSGADAPLILYGPYFEEDAEPALSNLDFDSSLKSRNRQWGIRQISDVDAVAKQQGFERAARHEMPANNLMLVYRRT